MAETNEGLPESITDVILRYLEAQEIITGDAEEGYLLKGDQPGLHNVRSFLNQIIANITDRAELIEDFQAKLKAHNQFPLFDLSTIIPEFFIDETLYDKLTFRESLVISCINPNESTLAPKVVGGLCLDIQKAKGTNPLYRKDIGLEQRLIELITAKLNALHNEDSSSKPTDAAETLSKTDIENLVKSNEELEAFTASIKPLYERTNCKFLVHVSSQFDVEGHMGGSRITAWVDRNFHTKNKNFKRSR